MFEDDILFTAVEFPVVKEIKQYQEKWLQHVQRMDTNRIPKQALQYKPNDEGTQDDRGRDGGTNFYLRIKEQETRLILHEHDDDEFPPGCSAW
jgi:hypothetical protein